MLKRKNTKLFLWFFISMLLEVCVLKKISVMGTKPMVVFLLILSTALLEKDFVKMLCVTIIASIVYAIMGAQVFGVELIFCVGVALGAYSLRKFPRYMNSVVRMCVFAAISTAIHTLLLHFYNYNQITFETILKTVLPSVIYNTPVGAALFWLFKLSVYEDEIKKESAFKYAK